MLGIKAGLDWLWFLVLFIVLLALLLSIQQRYIDAYSEAFIPVLFIPFKLLKSKRKGYQLIEFMPWIILFLIGFFVILSLISGHGFFGFFTGSVNYLTNIFPWT